MKLQRREADEGVVVSLGGGLDDDLGFGCGCGEGLCQRDERRLGGRCRRGLCRAGRGGLVCLAAESVERDGDEEHRAEEDDVSGRGLLRRDQAGTPWWKLNGKVVVGSIVPGEMRVARCAAGPG